MKYLFELSILALIAIAIVPATSNSTFVNTTDFWNTLVTQPLLFQSYTGYEDIDQYFPKDTASMYYSLWQGFGY